MKKTIFTLSLLMAGLLLSTRAFSVEPTYYGFNEGYKKAAAEKKVLMIHFYTEWCGWCKVMEKKTFNTPEVAAAIKKNFIAVKINPEIEGTYDYDGKKYTGTQLGELLIGRKIEGYPTVLFHSPRTKKGEIVAGYQNPEQFLPLLAKCAKMK